jgi:hypothetical protein
VPVLQAAATNAALQALKHAKQTSEQEAEAAAKQAELQAAAGDPWLNEDPQQAASSLSPVRVSCSCACAPHRLWKWPHPTSRTLFPSLDLQ